MSNNLDYKQSFWRSNLYEFCEEVLIINRKKHGLSQKIIAEQLGINQSEISRIERGIVKPKNIVTSETLCDIYKLSPIQKQKYLELTTGVSERVDNTLLSNLIDTQISSIANLNRSGSPTPAIEQSKQLREWIESNINLNDKTNYYMNEKVSHLMLEESAAWWDILVPEETFERTNSLIDKMGKIAAISNANTNLASVYLSINKGFHAYILEDYKNAKNHFADVISSTFLDKTLWGYEVIRAYSVTLGKLSDFNSLSQIENLIYKIVNDNSVEDSAKGYLLEGLGRAYTDINAKKAQTYFELAFNHINVAKKDPNFLKIRHIQLTRSYLSLLKKLPTSQEKLVQIATPALSEAEKSGFIRHKLQIVNLLNI